MGPSSAKRTETAEDGARVSHRTRVGSASFPIVELRQYTLHEGQRDRLIDLFEQHFIEPQEVLGMKIIGTFRDVHRPDRFVWIRGFEDMDSRLDGLTQFYGGDVWQAHRETANATMIDSDNVLLVRALCSAASFNGGQAGSATSDPNGVVVATLYHLKAADEPEWKLFEDQVKPKLEQAGVPVLAWFVTVAEANNYPRLPVREGENVLLWFSRFDDRDAFEQNAGVIADAERPLRAYLESPTEVLVLEPTGRSELR